MNLLLYNRPAHSGVSVLLCFKSVQVAAVLNQTLKCSVTSFLPQLLSYVTVDVYFI